MKTAILLAATMAALISAANAQPLPPTPQTVDWTTLTMTADLKVGADAGWMKIGGNDFCGIARYLDVKSCVVTSGTGDPGSVRTIDTGAVQLVEIVVARTAHSYTYAQPIAPVFYQGVPVQPPAPAFLHGTLAVEPVDKSHSKLVFTLIWNQAAQGGAAAQNAMRENRRKRFQAGVDMMAATANGL